MCIINCLIAEFPSPVRQQNSNHDGAALVAAAEENLEQGQGGGGSKTKDSVAAQEGGHPEITLISLWWFISWFVQGDVSVFC